MTIETMDDLPETPLQDVKPARGRFNNGNVMPMLERFYPAPQIQVMRDHGVDQRMMFGINPYYMALVRGEEYRDAEGKVVLPAMPPSKPLEALVVPILAAILMGSILLVAAWIVWRWRERRKRRKQAQNIQSP